MAAADAVGNDGLCSRWGGSIFPRVVLVKKKYVMVRVMCVTELPVSVHLFLKKRPSNMNINGTYVVERR